MGLFIVGIIFILFIILILIIVFIITNYNTLYNSQNYNTLYNSQKKGGNNNILNNDIMYYSICNHDYGLKYEKLESILQKHNFIMVSADKPAHVSFGSSEKITIHKEKKSYHDPLFITQHAAIKNTLGGQKQIIDKVMLFKTIKQLIPSGIKYLPKTYTIFEFENLEKPSISETKLQRVSGLPITYILKKDKTSKQQGVRVFFDAIEYYKAKKELNIKNDAIISEYITNPKTIEGKKINIRLFVILSIESGIKRCYIHDEITIATALKPYIASDWLNPEIHISGGKYTNKYYKWPQDIYGHEGMPNDVKHNFVEFKKTLAMGIALTDMSIYHEFFIGYKVFAVDAMITENNQFFILEVNNCIGFGCAGFGITDADECHTFSNRFSEDYFSFILDSVVFPPLGIKRRPIALAEVITVGTLSPFSGVLIGSNQCILIPLSDAHDYEIAEAKKIHFYHLNIESLLNEKYNIFLIKNKKNIIGYISIEKDFFYLTIAIEKQYQNRGIATTMIAQLLEIYAAKYFINGGKLYMKKPHTSIFIDKIAHKLKFTLHNNIYERPYKITDKILNKILNNQLLTCNIHINDGTDFNILWSLIDKYVVNTVSQFVHLSFTTIDKEHYEMIHASTGSKFGHHFITQGAELKSSLNIKILYGAKLKDYIGHKYFTIKDKTYSDDIIGINIYFVLYMKNGLKTCYNMDYYTYDKMLPNGDFISIKESDFIINYSMDKIKKFMQEVAQLIIKNNFSIYEESNAGFNVFHMYVQIIDNAPKIKLCNPNLVLINYQNNTDLYYTQHVVNFSKKYYEWLCHCVIFPHFGLLKHHQYIAPIATELIHTNKKLKAEIISELVLQFNNIASASPNIVDIYLSNKKIGFIKFKSYLESPTLKSPTLKSIELPYIFMDHIELSIQYRKKDIAINILFLFMETLAAYYAPSSISLIMLYCKQMHDIAFELEFAKIDNIYMRKCRL